MPRCAGITGDGDQCSRDALPGQRHCWWHSAAHSAERRRIASKAARARHSHGREVKQLRQLLETIASSVLNGQVDPRRGAVAVQAVNARIRLLDVSLRAREMEELSGRLEWLEEQISGGDTHAATW